MFARVSDASKCAFAHFAQIMFENGVPWIDCQVYTDHLARFGAKNIPRNEYLKLLGKAIAPSAPFAPQENKFFGNI